MNRRSAPRLPLAPLAVAACLALTSCAHHGETARTSPRSASPPATGSLAEVECGGLTPVALRAELAEAPDPGYEAPAEWLAEAVEPDDDARLRAYLRCLAERGAGPADQRSPVVGSGGARRATGGR